AATAPAFPATPALPSAPAVTAAPAVAVGHVLPATPSVVLAKPAVSEPAATARAVRPAAIVKVHVATKPLGRVDVKVKVKTHRPVSAKVPEIGRASGRER